MARLLAGLVLLLLLPSVGLAAPLERAIASYEAGDYESAATLLLPLAEQGDALAQFYVGVLYFNGWHLERNLGLAADWFEKSARQGLPEAQANIAYLYRHGIGRAQNARTAFSYYGAAAYQCHLGAQRIYAAMLFTGEGTAQDEVLGYAWTKISAALGDEEAAAILPTLLTLITDEEKRLLETHYRTIEQELRCS